MGSDNPIEEDDVYSVTPEGTLIISSVEALYQGTYRCVVTNAIGKIEASADVRLVGKYCDRHHVGKYLRNFDV